MSIPWIEKALFQSVQEKILSSQVCGQLFCYNTSVSMSLQTPAVKTTRILCFKNLLALLSLPFSIVFTLRSTNKAILVVLLQTL